jgi:tripartite-type tricarboxylate transporter receptor subunit TctC
MRHRRALIAATAALLIGSPVAAQEQDWPNRPVTIVYPFAPGGNDAAVRFIAKALSEKFGQSFIVEIRSGAGGGIGSAQVAKSPPDGYTLLYTAIGPAVLNSLLYKSVSYEDADFAPVILLADAPHVIVGSPKLGFKSLAELVAYGKTNPGKTTLGHAGAGTTGNLAAALFLARTGIDGSLIGYRGAVPAITDVVSGQIVAAFPIYLPIAENATVLAVTSEQRMSFLPNVPTARESGVDVVASTWVAMMGPAGMPRSIVTKLNAAIDAYLKSPEGSEAFAKMGLRVLGGPPDRLTQTIKDDRTKWQPVIRDANIKPD